MARVFASPGTPSNNMCPSDNRATKSRSTISFCPTITLLSSIVSKSIIALSLFILSFSCFMSIVVSSIVFVLGEQK